jgi:hypothetical protein
MYKKIRSFFCDKTDEKDKIKNNNSRHNKLGS